MFTQVFNTEFEISLRLICLLFCSNKKLSFEKIVYLDFISTYSRDFSLTNSNIHGNSNFKLSELITRRLIVSNSIKQLVIDRYFIPSTQKKTLVYKISKKGCTFIKNMNDDYIKQLLEIDKIVVEKYDKKSEEQIFQEIYSVVGR